MLAEKIASAFQYAYPLYAFAETRYRALQNPENPHRHPPNSIQHNRHLSDHKSSWITAPNNDTLYSNAWLDLSSGPVRIRVREMPQKRYWSLAFMDAFTNHIAILGQRVVGTGPLDVTLVGPGDADRAVEGQIIHAPGNDVWLFCRCLVDGPSDLPQAHAMQDRIEVLPHPSAKYADRVRPEGSTSPEVFLDVVNELLGRNPVPDFETGMLEGWAEVGLRPGVRGALHDISEEARAAWTDRIDALHHDLKQAGKSGRRDFRGWIAAASDIGNFGRNYALRASVALGGLGALEPIEAMYFVKYQDEIHQTLDGRRQYLLKVPPSGIPTDSFWSFTMYEATPDGKRFLVENPLSRFSLGNRTPGIVYNADGSLDIGLQRDAPTDPTLRANWLPTPEGPFQIALRAYLPRPEIRDGSAELPVVVAADDG